MNHRRKIGIEKKERLPQQRRYFAKHREEAERKKTKTNRISDGRYENDAVHNDSNHPPENVKSQPANFRYGSKTYMHIPGQGETTSSKSPIRNKVPYATKAEPFLKVFTDRNDGAILPTGFAKSLEPTKMHLRAGANQVGAGPHLQAQVVPPESYTVQPFCSVLNNAAGGPFGNEAETGAGGRRRTSQYMTSNKDRYACDKIQREEMSVGTLRHACDGESARKLRKHSSLRKEQERLGVISHAGMMNSVEDSLPSQEDLLKESGASALHNCLREETCLTSLGCKTPANPSISNSYPLSTTPTSLTTAGVDSFSAAVTLFESLMIETPDQNTGRFANTKVSKSSKDLPPRVEEQNEIASTLQVKKTEDTTECNGDLPAKDLWRAGEPPTLTKEHRSGIPSPSPFPANQNTFGWDQFAAEDILFRDPQAALASTDRIDATNPVSCAARAEPIHN